MTNKEKVIIFLYFILLANSCAKKINTVVIGKENCFNFVNVKDSFDMIIIDYKEGCHCGVRACASNCIGITTAGDTFRVLSLCNTDSTFKIGMNIKVIPKLKPSYDVTVAYNHFSLNIDDSCKAFENKNIKTIYGELLKK